MVTEPERGPEYPNGFPLFTWLDGGHRATVCLTYPEDGSPPLPLASIRILAAEHLAKEKEQKGPGDPSVRFLEEYLEALDDLIAQRSRYLPNFMPQA